MTYKTFSYFTCVILFYSLVLISCRQEETIFIEDNLCIDSQVPMTRSGAGDGKIVDPNKEAWRKIHMTQDKEEKCGTWALAEMLIRDEGIDENHSADSKLKKIDDYANSHFDDATNLKTSQMLQIGREFGLCDTQADFMPNDAYPDYVPPSRNDFFSEHQGNVIVNYLNNGESHWAYCTGITDNGKVQVIDKDGYYNVKMDRIQAALYQK